MKQKEHQLKRACHLLGLLVGLLFLPFGFGQAAQAETSDSATLSVEQNVVGFPIGTSGIFQYQLTAKDGQSPLPEGSESGTYTFAMRQSASRSIEMPKYTKEGRYTYELRQVIPQSKPDGYQYDAQVYTIEVHVDRKESKLVSTLFIKNAAGEKTTEAEFTNRYKVLNSTGMENLPIQKTVEGKPKEQEKFHFQLQAKDKTNPMPDGSEKGKKVVSIKGSGVATFGTWQYDQEGVYYYTVSEVDTKKPKYTYDPTVYTITDKVQDENGKLVVKRRVTNPTKKIVGAYLFINRYNEKGKATSDSEDEEDEVDEGENRRGGLPQTLGDGGDDPIEDDDFYEDDFYDDYEDDFDDFDDETSDSRRRRSLPKTGLDKELYLYLAGLAGCSLLALICAGYLIKNKRKKG